MKRLWIYAIIFLFVFPMFGRYKGKYKDWIEGPVRFLVTKKEKKAFKKLKSDEQAEKFIALFWAKRDPTPKTAINEFKERFKIRVAKADELFSTQYQKGSLTDRGMVYILLGEPTYKRVSDYYGGEGGVGSEGVSGDSSMRGKFLRGEMEVWLYRKDKLPPNVPQQEMLFKFIKEEGYKDFIMDRVNPQPLQALELAKESFIVSPDLKELPAYEKPKGPSPLFSKVQAILKGEEPETPQGALFTYAPFFLEDGSTYISFQVFIPKKDIPKEEKQWVVIIDDKKNNQVIFVDEKAPLQETHGALYWDRSLMLPPGSYRGVFAFGTPEGTLQWAKVEEIEIPDMASEDYKEIYLVLSNDVSPLKEKQYATDPFCFGGGKVVPRADGVFRQEDELWYFVNVFHPALDENGEPHIQFSVAIYNEDNRRIRKSATYDAQLAKLNKGRYAFGRMYYVGQDLHLKEGQYFFQITIVDKVGDKKWERKIPFQVKG